MSVILSLTWHVCHVIPNLTGRHDMIVEVDWSLKTIIYLSTWQVCGYTVLSLVVLVVSTSTGSSVISSPTCQVPCRQTCVGWRCPRKNVNKLFDDIKYSSSLIIRVSRCFIPPSPHLLLPPSLPPSQKFTLCLVLTLSSSLDFKEPRPSLSGFQQR